jgi:NADPH2:quinone reductase
MKASITTLMKDLAEKRIQPQIFERLPLEEAARAHELLESRAVMGKIILQP